jgi:hypothetical protein
MSFFYSPPLFLFFFFLHLAAHPIASSTPSSAGVCPPTAAASSIPPFIISPPLPHPPSPVIDSTVVHPGRSVVLPRHLTFVIVCSATTACPPAILTSSSLRSGPVAKSTGLPPTVPKNCNYRSFTN